MTMALAGGLPDFGTRSSHRLARALGPSSGCLSIGGAYAAPTVKGAYNDKGVVPSRLGPRTRGGTI